MIAMWGLKNCDACRKARKWLEAEGIAFSFKDVRADQLNLADISKWLEVVGPDVLINRRGTTWRNLSPEAKEAISGTNAAALVLEMPAVMKRPIFVSGQTVLVGFTDEVKKTLALMPDNEAVG